MRNHQRYVWGIMDSGLGGLGIFREWIRKFPKVPVVYVADRKNFPYGLKSEESLRIILRDNLHYMRDKYGVNRWIVGCNTASISLQKHWNNILHGDWFFCWVVPDFQACYGRDASPWNVGVLATKTTFASSVYKNRVKQCMEQSNGMVNIHDIQADGMIDKIEWYWPNMQHLMTVIEKSLCDWKGHLDMLVLGCTHFTIVQDLFIKIFGERCIVTHSNALALHSVDVHGLLSGLETQHVFVDTGIGYSQASKKEIIRFLRVKDPDVLTWELASV